MRKLILTLLIGGALIVGCAKDEPNPGGNTGGNTGGGTTVTEGPCNDTRTKRVGARCKDGTRSYATGSGACSGHGGVDYWICSE